MDVQYSARYHHIAERWFAGFRRLANFMNLFLGSAAAITALSGAPLAAAIAGILVVAVAVLDTVYDTSGKVAIHRNLYQRFLDLEARVKRQNTDVPEIDAAIAEIERDEPPINERLRVIAYEANLRTAGHQPSNLTGLNRILANWL
jgi:hypothetical protein